MVKAVFMPRSWSTDSVAGTVAGRGGDGYKDEYDTEVCCRSTSSRGRRNEGDRDWSWTSVCHRKQRGNFHCRHFTWRYVVSKFSVVKKNN